MRDNIFIKDEFLKKTGVLESELKQWEDKKLIEPSGYTDDKIPCYSNEALEHAGHIKRFIELGYELEEIHKIIKKVGLPKSTDKAGSKKTSGKYLTVGNLAEKVGISPRTIKHWEDKGIIEPDMRSEGGFRLYSENYIYLCQLIRDLQLFGYSLEEIHEISIHFREFTQIQQNVNVYPYSEIEQKIEIWQGKIQSFFEKTAQLKEGIHRWEDLLKKKKREIGQLKNQNQKRIESQKGEKKK